MNTEKLLEKTDIKISKKADCIYCGENFIITDLEEKLLQKHKFKNPEHCPKCWLGKKCIFKLLCFYWLWKYLL